jgi:hypothetical protein
MRQTECVLVALALVSIGASAPNLEYQLDGKPFNLDSLRGGYVLVLTGLGADDAPILEAIGKLEIQKPVRLLPLSNSPQRGFAVAAEAAREPFGGDARRATLVNPGGRVTRIWSEVGDSFAASFEAWMKESSIEIGAPATDPRPHLAETGRLANWSKPEGEKGLLVLFLASKGPVDELYAERLAQIAESCKAAGVGVIALFSAYDETAADVEAAKLAYKWQFDCSVDTGSGFADAYRAARTPEAFLLDKSGNVAYTGAIDSSTFPRDTNRKYLLDAIAAVAEGKPPKPARTMPFGTVIRRSSADDRSR